MFRPRLKDYAHKRFWGRPLKIHVLEDEILPAAAGLDAGQVPHSIRVLDLSRFEPEQEQAQR
jgi:hypothetical protein